MPEADIIIRGGIVFDGSGNEPFKADVALLGDRIVQVGDVKRRSKREIDARGLMVTPGFVDIHTHYDGQVTWSQRVTPSSWLGVTTVVMGNCGVGFAPCRAEHHEMLVNLMEGVEDIPEIVMTEGVPWKWQSFPEYIGFLSGRRYDVDIAAQMPHAALRVFVMAERGAQGQVATESDLATMRQVTREAIEAGALGVSSSRTIHHRSADGDKTPTFAASEAELMAIAMGMRAGGGGVLQMATDMSDWNGAEAEFAMLRRVVEASGQPLSISLTQREETPDGWRKVLDLIGDAVSAGLPIKAQVAGRPVGLLLGLSITQHPFVSHPSYKKIVDLPLDQRVKLLGDPALKAQILSEQKTAEGMRPGVYNYDKLYEMSDPPDYEPAPETSLGARARAAGRSPDEFAYDILLKNEGKALLYRPMLNYADGTMNTCLEMFRDPNTIVALGDGGAHYGLICDASIPTFMVSHWARDRSRGERLALPRVIKAITSDAATVAGFKDRGLVREGYKADLNIIDFARLQLRIPEVHHDLPGGGKRLVQMADGYAATILSGCITYEEGVATGDLPGRVVLNPRGAKHSP